MSGQETMKRSKAGKKVSRKHKKGTKNNPAKCSEIIATGRKSGAGTVLKPRPQKELGSPLVRWGKKKGI